MSTEALSQMAWGSPFGLGFMVISIGIFLLAMGKFLVDVSQALRTISLPPREKESRPHSQ